MFIRICQASFYRNSLVLTWFIEKAVITVGVYLQILRSNLSKTVLYNGSNTYDEELFSTVLWKMVSWNSVFPRMYAKR